MRTSAPARSLRGGCACSVMLLAATLVAPTADAQLGHGVSTGHVQPGVTYTLVHASVGEGPQRQQRALALVLWRDPAPGERTVHGARPGETETALRAARRAAEEAGRSFIGSRDGAIVRDAAIDRRYRTLWVEGEQFTIPQLDSALVVLVDHAAPRGTSPRVVDTVSVSGLLPPEFWSRGWRAGDTLVSIIPSVPVRAVILQDALRASPRITRFLDAAATEQAASVMVRALARPPALAPDRVADAGRARAASARPDSARTVPRTRYGVVAGVLLDSIDRRPPLPQPVVLYAVAPSWPAIGDEPASDSSRFVRRVLTNDAGRFRIDRVPQGAYRVVIGGFNTERLEFSLGVGADDTVHVVYALPPQREPSTDSTRRAVYRAELARARERWSRRRPERYTIAVEWRCACFGMPEWIPEVTVQGDSVVSVRVGDHLREQEGIFERALTVDSLFVWIEAELRHSLRRVDDLAFDAWTGVPVRVSSDVRSPMTDGWTTIRVLEFIPLEPDEPWRLPDR